MEAKQLEVSGQQLIAIGTKEVKELVRTDGKIARRALTDACQRMDAYVDLDGEASKNPGGSYKGVSRSINTHFKLMATQIDAKENKLAHRDLWETFVSSCVAVTEQNIADYMNWAMDHFIAREVIKSNRLAIIHRNAQHFINIYKDLFKTD